MNDSEMDGLETFKKMGLNSYGDLGHVQIVKLYPNKTTIRSDEHLEFDFFILYNNICLVGEMSGISDRSDIKDKYLTFRDNFELLVACDKNDKFSIFNIPKDKLYLFSDVMEYKAFFIAYKHERFDVDIQELDGIPIIYKGDWSTIKSYADSIGSYAKNPFLSLVKTSIYDDKQHDLKFSGSKHKLVCESNKKITKEITTRADVFTFSTSPEELLSVAEVFRRELMPIITSGADEKYQRPLDFEKLKDMRNLVMDKEFMFPNNILISLDENCEYDKTKNELRIPMSYGSVSVIDGQHRLFSYASRGVDHNIRATARILVTALQFKTSDRAEILQCSAATFIEINQNQKRISSDHIDEIAYSVLKKTYPQALAAQVILRSNKRYNKILSGLFSSSQTSLGIFKAATIIVQLAPILNLETITSLTNARTSSQKRQKQGYELLCSVPTVDQLTNTEDLIQQVVVCLERYCNILKRVFDKDWPDKSKLKRSTLEYTKVFAALIRLLNQFIKEGLNWNEVESQLRIIKSNVIEARKLPKDYNGVVFERGSSDVPDDKVSITNDFKFFQDNRLSPKSIIDVKSNS